MNARPQLGPSGKWRRVIGGKWRRAAILATMGLLALMIANALAAHDTGRFQLDGDASSGTQPGSPPAPEATDDWDRVCHQVTEPKGTGTLCSTEDNTTEATAVSWAA